MEDRLPPPLVPDEIERGLNPRLVGRQIKVWKRIRSTNDLAARAAASRENDGLVILAEEQTGGRGRQGRKWFAPPGTGILMSVLLFPPARIDQPESLVCLSAVCAAEALDEFVTQPIEIKWPNDLYVGGKKVGGILVERGLGTVIGIGINVHAVPPSNDLASPAICLQDLAATALDRSVLVRRLLQVLDARYADACLNGIDSVVLHWRHRAAFLGECVEIEVRGQPVSGTLLEIDPLTSLALRTAHGAVDRFPLTEVQSFRRI